MRALNAVDKICLSIGQSRFEKVWKRSVLTFDELCERLKTTTRTTETQGQYFNMSKSRQDEIKDVGGFVGGTLREGRRKSGAVIKRYIVTLDADFAKPDFIDTVTLIYPEQTWCVYSTHKHTPEKPRLRLIIPLSRPVDPDEYEAISRKVADIIGIDQFDDTTYQAQRLMYWPSTSIDGEYVFEKNDGAPLCADDVLNMYDNWRDATEWPVSSRTVKKHERRLKKQQDPTEKGGIVGAFCRTYDIYGAIDKFLNGIYEPCAHEDRFTYTGGSTSAGLVVYEDGKFAYSNHATDPAGGMLCNAFDLCRVHLYGDLDDEAKEGTPTAKMPSYKAMIETAGADPDVRKLIHRERFEGAASDFEGVGDTESLDDNWILEMETNNQGGYLKTRKNAVLILENDPALRGKIALNEFTQRTQALGALAWDPDKSVRDWTDNDDAGLRYYIEKAYGIDSEKKILDAVKIVSVRHKFNPVRNYLNSLIWDGKERAESLFIDYMGARDNAYIRAVTRKSLVAAVARVMEPGVKFDSIVVLVGKQGCGKSQIIKKLGGEWFSDTLTTMQGKEAYEQIQGFWIIEIAELAAMKRAEIESIKHFVSKSEDAYRAAYGRRVSNYKRQCVFFGTTNTHEFLRDMTGNRRFWPIDVNPEIAPLSIWQDLDQKTVDQIWAEAVCMYRDGEPLYIDDRGALKIAEKEQNGHLDESPLTGDVKRYLEITLPDDWASRDLSQRRGYIHGTEFGDEAKGSIKREKVCPLEIWCEMFYGDRKDFDRRKSREIKDILSKIDGWEDMKKVANFGNLYGSQRGFARINNN